MLDGGVDPKATERHGKLSIGWVDPNHGAASIGKAAY